ncbi:MAG: LytTR family DNA-binding domain-containing protein [Anaerovoracaceae bacterium]
MKIGLCDDQIEIMKACQADIELLADDNQINVEIKAFKGVEQLLFALEENPNQIELLLLEVNFQEGPDGIQTAHKLRSWGYTGEIIFLTRDKSRVYEAFDVSAMHYIVKGVTTQSKFKEIFQRAIDKLTKKEEDELKFSCAGESRCVEVSEIKYFEVIGRMIVVHYGNETFEFYSTLGRLGELLYNKGFIRNHKAYLVALNAIKSLTAKEITLKDGSILPLSRTYARKVKDAFMARSQEPE